MVLNRYLPKWTWDRFENYNNDYRWSKKSPPVTVMGYRRYYNVTSENLSKIDVHWIDLGQFDITQAAILNTMSVSIATVFAVGALLSY